jgi:F-type H+-transporting ATPase subunit a
MFMMFVVMALLIIAGAGIANGAKLVPGRWQSTFEVAAEFMLDLVEGTGGRTFGRRIFPLVGSIFIFLLIANYTGILPGVGTIGVYRSEPATEEVVQPEPGDEAIVASAPGTEEAAPAAEHRELVPILRAPTADLSLTLSMALVTFVTVQILGIRAHGVVGRIKHMANPPFIFPIEVVSELGRIISLSARLFGNVFAGEVLLGVMYAMVNAIKIAIVPLFVPVIFIFLEILFGSIQALVFALLTAIYITMAAADEHAEEPGGHAGEPHTPEPVAGPRGPAGAGD